MMDDTPTSTDTLDPAAFDGSTTMGDLLAAFPGARRALFSRYHIGGCSSCGFEMSETLAAVCERNENLPVEEALRHIRASHEEDRKLMIEPAELARLREAGEDLALLDIRTREEHEAVHIEGSRMLTEVLMQKIMGQWPRERRIVIYDHTGDRSLDATAFFVGHDFQNARALEGGIDRWSREIDPDLPRYHLE